MFTILVEVVHDEKKQAIVIEGKLIPSPNEKLLVKELVECQKEGKQFCPECTLGLDIKHTDVLILSQYVRPDGCMLPRRVTGLCKRQQKRIGGMVTMAQKAGLMMVNINGKLLINDTKNYDCRTLPRRGLRKILRLDTA